jgi:inward rectifier potassium channel
MFKRIKENGKEFGFGNAVIGKNQRIVNKDWTFNVSGIGLPMFERFSFFHWMINTSWLVFVSIVVIFFLLSNAFFSLIYDAILGVNQFHGMETKTALDRFMDLFYFSTQAFSTVGYGRINSATNMASFMSAIDAFTGVLFFSIDRLDGPILQPGHFYQHLLPEGGNNMGCIFRENPRQQ